MLVVSPWKVSRKGCTSRAGRGCPVPGLANDPGQRPGPLCVGGRAVRSGPAGCTRLPTARPAPPTIDQLTWYSMRDRNLVPTAVVGAIVCCGAMALSVAAARRFPCWLRSVGSRPSRSPVSAPSWPWRGRSTVAVSATTAAAPPTDRATVREHGHDEHLRPDGHRRRHGRRRSGEQVRVPQGWKVAIVDELPYGGTCALRGCDPKKILRLVAPRSSTAPSSWPARASTSTASRSTGPT